MFLGNRLYLASVAAVMIGLLIGALMLELNTEQRVRDIEVLSTAQARKADVAQYLRRMVDAETSQHGFLLTQDPQYLELYQEARRTAPDVLERVTENYLSGDHGLPSDAIRDDLNRLRELGNTKLDELAASFTLGAANQRQEAIDLVRTNLGKRTTDELRAVAADLDAREDRHMEEALRRWEHGTFTLRAMLVGGTMLNIALVVAVAVLLNRDLRRREEVSRELARHSQELEFLVTQRTAELSALSSHLQSVAEREKAAIARELHDELGGIMLAAKMDAAWLERKISASDGDLSVRWARLRKLLDDGLNLKRRVVETLRPTLLDNMGLIPAVKWLLQETCGRAGLKLTELYPDDDLRLNDEAAIAVFRVVQEALTNVVKHAKASRLTFSMLSNDQSLQIEIADDGVGIAPRHATRRSQGLASMQHRVTSFGGTWRINAPPTGGTLVKITLPRARVWSDARINGE